MNKYSKSKFVINPLPLIIPGTQDWQNPKVNPQITENNLISTRNISTTREIQQYLNIPQKYISACRIGFVLNWKSCLIWHKGRDSWEIYDLRE